MATKKAVTKPAVPTVNSGKVVTKFGTFQVGTNGVITQTVFPKDVAKHTGSMTAEEVAAEIRRQA